MRKNLITPAICFLILFEFMALRSHAQCRAKYLPANGFWELVTNVNIKDVTTIQFYTNDSQLVYEEKVANVKFNLNRAKTFRWLKEGLDKALVAFNQNKKPVYDKEWIADIAKR